MRSVSGIICAVSTACLVAFAAPALAYELDGESYHADSFGNLVVYSPAGYKRIIVGKGHVLDEYRQAQRTSDPDVVYYRDDRRERYQRRCRYEPGMFKGRSYMYGLPDGVVPSPARRVCD